MDNIHEMHKRFNIVIFLIFAFLAGCIFTGIFFYRSGPWAVRELDRRYNLQHERAAGIIGRLEDELERERDINRRLREHNWRAREIADGLADTTERNVRNLQDAISLIGEIRRKIQVLADFYADSDTGDGDN